jgi:hypothetical protein
MQPDGPRAEDHPGTIEVAALLGGAVAADCSAVQLDFLTAAGGQATLTLPAHLVARTMVSVLALLAELQQRSSGSATDIVHPVESWQLDQVTAPGHALMTFTTTEGVRMPFLIAERDLAGIVEAIALSFGRQGETRH